MVKYDPNKIQQLRTSRGLSPSEFAAAIGASKQAVSLWEIGAQKISAATIEKICTAFDVQPNFFFTGAFATKRGNNKG